MDCGMPNMEQKLRREIDAAAERGEDEFFTWFAGGKDANNADAQGAWDMAYHILRPPVARYLKITNEKAALEIGYGGGRLVAAASPFFGRVYGVDIHDQREVVTQRLRSRGIPNVELLQNQGSDIPLPDASVDFVFSFTVFNHLSSFAVFDEYLAETARVLRDGGVASLYVARSYNGAIKQLPLTAQRIHYFLENVAETAQAIFGKGYREKQPVTSKWGTTLMMSRNAAMRVCKKHGLQVVRTGHSYYQVPEHYPRLGSQRWLCLIKA